MSTVPIPPIPKSRIPAWERRRGPERWRWNGQRRGDPRLPSAGSAGETNPARVLLVAAMGSLAGIGILFFALR